MSVSPEVELLLTRIEATRADVSQMEGRLRSDIHENRKMLDEYRSEFRATFAEAFSRINATETSLASKVPACEMNAAKVVALEKACDECRDDVKKKLDEHSAMIAKIDTMTKVMWGALATGGGALVWQVIAWGMQYIHFKP